MLIFFQENLQTHNNFFFLSWKWNSGDNEKFHKKKKSEDRDHSIKKKCIIIILEAYLKPHRLCDFDFSFEKLYKNREGIETIESKMKSSCLII